MGSKSKFTKKQNGKTYSFPLFFCSDCTFGDETYTVNEETPFLGLPVFLR